MPNCIQLTKHGEKEPTPFVVIDQEICDHFGVPCDPKHWHHGWYDIIGFLLAMGHDWRYIHESTAKDIARCEECGDVNGAKWNRHLDEITSFLEQRYTTNAWYEHKSAPSILADERHASKAS